MQPRVLFSPVGLTDPIRNLYDGPLLHIVRHYQPAKVYLFITAEMAKYDQLDDRYAKSVLAVKPDCQIEKIPTDIQDPHNFDRFIGVFSRHIEQIAQANPGCKILLNLTSGTPQMLLALALEAVLLPYDLLALQVATPENRSNINNHPVGADFDLAEQLAYNIDQQDPASPNRCRELPLAILRKNNVKQSILSLIQRYEYDGALAVYHANSSLLPSTVGYLLRHACARVNLALAEAKKHAAKTQCKIDLFPVTKTIPQELTEYFMIMTIRQRCGQLPDFLLRITPFLFHLSKYYLETVLKFPLSRYTRLRQIDGVVLLDENKLALEPELKQIYDDEFGGAFHTRELSFTNLLPVFDYLLQTSCNTSAKRDISSIRERLRQLRFYEMELRNQVAHTITSISEQTFARAAQRLHSQNPDYDQAMTSAKLLAEIESVMQAMLGLAVKNYVFIYDSINQTIAELLKD